MDRIQLLKEILIAVKKRNCHEDFGLGSDATPKYVTERERCRIVCDFIRDLCSSNWEDQETGILLEMIEEEISMNFYRTRNLDATYTFEECDCQSEEKRDRILQSYAEEDNDHLVEEYLEGSINDEEFVARAFNVIKDRAEDEEEESDGDKTD